MSVKKNGTYDLEWVVTGAVSYNVCGVVFERVVFECEARELLFHPSLTHKITIVSLTHITKNELKCTLEHQHRYAQIKSLSAAVIEINAWRE